LLRKDERAAAQAVIGDIVQDILQLPKDQPDPCGDAGYALLFTYLALSTGESRYTEFVEEYHARALDGAATLSLPPALYSGFVGIAWMDCHLNRVLFRSDDDSTEDVDDVLGTLLREAPWRRPFDLILGLVGYGVYFLEKSAPSSDLVSLVLDRLVETSETQPDGMTWHTPQEFIKLPKVVAEYPDGYYNLGVAHGVPGIVAFLARLLSSGVAPPRTRALLVEAVRWLLAQRLDHGGAYPSWMYPGKPQKPARTAWCYGNPGVAGTLMLAARATGDSQWGQSATTMALASARVPYDETQVIDAGLCHGAAGLALMYLRWWWMTSDPVFEQAARSWLARTLALRRPGQGIGGYVSWSTPVLPPGQLHSFSDSDWRPDPRFLTGATGVALALLAAVSDVHPDWDRLLLMS
jgi:lantibiotic modifying enzyme